MTPQEIKTLDKGDMIQVAQGDDSARYQVVKALHETITYLDGSPGPSYSHFWVKKISGGPKFLEARTLSPADIRREQWSLCQE